MHRLLILGALVFLSAVVGAEERRKRILLSNDDGISSPGLLAVYAQLAKLGEVTVAAPADNQSGVGHGVTLGQPILVTQIEPLAKGEGTQGPWYRIAARPATGDPYFWNIWTEPEGSDPETDVGAIHAGYVAVTPHRIDLNDQEARQAIEAWNLR